MQNDAWNLDTAKEIKVIKLLVYEQLGKLPLLDYLTSISDLTFSTHASEMRYGETYYYRGAGKNIKAVVVPTITLSALPRRYRKEHWYYLTIYCHPEDERFDTFPDYETASASQYNI